VSVAILCAVAAVEAQMNSVGDAIDPAWWKVYEPKSVAEKWRALHERRAGTQLPDDDETLSAVVRINLDRNLVSHWRGLRQAMGRTSGQGHP
jgi:hypothetical protein